MRGDWLKRHGLPHPLILNTGPKGPVTAALVAQTPQKAAFVDDLLPNLDSVAEHAPAVATFQHVADERLRPLAPRSERHPRIDDWAELATYAAGRGVRIGAVNPNLFGDDNYRLGSLCHPDADTRRRAWIAESSSGFRPKIFTA